jgi:hypothetical protein
MLNNDYNSKRSVKKMLVVSHKGTVTKMDWWQTASRKVTLTLTAPLEIFQGAHSFQLSVCI